MELSFYRHNAKIRYFVIMTVQGFSLGLSCAHRHIYIRGNFTNQTMTTASKELKSEIIYIVR